MATGPDTSAEPLDPSECPDDLTANQHRFCVEYVASNNALRAYRLAFPEATEATCRRESHRLAKTPHVAREVARQRAVIAERAGISAVDVLSRFWDIADLDPAELYEPDPDDPSQLKPIPLHRLPPDVRKAVKQVKLKRKRLRAEGPRGDTTQWEVEQCEYLTYDRLEALIAAGKHLGLFADGKALETLLSLLSAGGAGRPPEGPAAGEPK